MQVDGLTIKGTNDTKVRNTESVAKAQAQFFVQFVFFVVLKPCLFLHAGRRFDHKRHERHESQEHRVCCDGSDAVFRVEGLTTKSTNGMI